MAKTGDTRRTAKNADGLQGQSPVDPNLSEVLVADPGSALMGIQAPGGTPVRATHPGRVRDVTKFNGAFTIEIVALDDLLNTRGLSFADLPATLYAGLGGVDVAPGEKVVVGQQIGTVAFAPSYGGPGGTTGINYTVLANGSGTKAAQRHPQSEEGLRIVGFAQDNGGPPADSVLLKEPPPEPAVGDPGLNEAAAANALDENAQALANAGTANYPYVTNPQVRFVEQKNQVFSHDVMVFINGVDVTGYLVGNLTINIVDKDGWNECNLTLNNSLNNFVITLENLGFNRNLRGVYRTSDIYGEQKYSEKAKKEIIVYKTNPEINPFVDVASMRLVDTRVTQGVANIEGTGKEVAAASQAPVEDQAAGARRDGQRGDLASTPAGNLVDRRWQLGFQSAVFHKHDPIRIFRKNPIRETDEWMPAFTGYLNEISYDTNYINGQSQIKLSCYDIRALAAKMRVQETAVTAVTNPRAIFRGEDAAGSGSLFTDLLNPTAVGTPLGSERFEDVMEFLITGTSTESRTLNQKFGESKFSRGIGDFTLGEKILYRPGDRATGTRPDPLEHWHALCLFGTDGAYFLSGSEDEEPGLRRGTRLGNFHQGLGSRFDRRFLTQAEATIIGRATTHDGDWAPHKQFVHFLLPADGTGAKNLLEADAANVSSNQIDFRSRLDIMQDFAARIDYQFWVTPMGDFVVEFPQYDFLPEDYGEYRTVFQVDKHLTSDNIQDEAGDMVTAIIASGRIRPENEANIADPIQPKAVVVSPMMMMRYGVLEHELTLPFISDSKSLERVAQIEFQKKLAESNKMDMQFNYRPFLLPNRPVEHMERKRLGLTTAVNNSLIVFKEGDTAITCRYVRRQIIRENGVPDYTFIFSGNSMPISYRQIFAPGTIAPVSGPATEGLGLDTGGEQISRSNSAQPNVDTSTGTASNANVRTTAETIATPAASPTPTREQVGRFMAMAQQLSGWNADNRTPDGGYGLFNMGKDLRDSLGIGDTSNVVDQVKGADKHFRGLVSKYDGDYGAAVREFVLGPEEIKNPFTVENFEKGFGAVNERLAKEYEKFSQPLIDGFNKLFPGDEEPTDTEQAEASEEAKAAKEAAAAEPAPSGAGAQQTVGILVFSQKDSKATPENTESPGETQAAQNQIS